MEISAEKTKLMTSNTSGIDTKEEIGRHQGMDRSGVCRVPEGRGERAKMEETGCEIICGAPTTLMVNGLLIMMRAPGCIDIE